jgi:hypothetical protein
VFKFYDMFVSKYIVQDIAEIETIVNKSHVINATNERLLTITQLSTYVDHLMLRATLLVIDKSGRVWTKNTLIIT